MRFIALMMLLIIPAAATNGCNPVKTSINEEQTNGETALEIEPQPTPTMILERYLDARLTGAWAKAYEVTISESTQRDYVAESSRRAPLAPMIAEASDFKITSLSVDGSQAQADVTVTMPDLSPFIQKLLMLGVKHTMLGDPSSYEPILDELREALEKRELKLVSQDQRFVLIKSNDGWRVDVRGPTAAQ